MCSNHLLAGEKARLERAYRALSVYDYFKARAGFHKINKKKPVAEACYGLALIHSRNDNPFHNYDSASKYIRLSYHTFRKPVEFSGFVIDRERILALADSMGTRQLKELKSRVSVSMLDSFLEHSYLCNASIIKEAIMMRDEAEFNHMISAASSEATGEFVLTHPMSHLRMEAMILRDRQVYDETTRQRDAASFIRFIKENPGNIMTGTAYEKLFGIYSRNKDVRGLKKFVRDYPAAPQNLEAWKLLFSLTVKSYSYSELKNFLGNYPDFPLKNSILKDLELNKLALYPFQQDEYWGYVDSRGKIMIPAVYEAASSFADGAAIVNRNDSLFFVNKENVNLFNRIFSDALPFKNGVAAVKTGNKWCFMNRLGQMVTRQYDEVNELSGGRYVVKLDGKYGALDDYAQIVIEPRFEKLGDFKNGFAYFIAAGRYGFVSDAGVVFPAEFDWISDFSETGIAVVKQEDKFGLVNAAGEIVLAPAYELVIKAAGKVYIVVQNNLYGFYNIAGCFITPVAYEYAREKPPEYYTNGIYFKAIKKGIGLINANGVAVVNVGSFDEISFPSCGRMLARKKKLYGYLDTLFYPVIPFKFDDATDFKDSLAVVKKKNRYLLIKTDGNEVFESAGPVKRLSREYYYVDGPGNELINRKGEVIFTGVEKIENPDGHLLLLLSNGEIKLLSG